MTCNEANSAHGLRLPSARIRATDGPTRFATTAVFVALGACSTLPPSGAAPQNDAGVVASRDGATEPDALLEKGGPDGTDAAPPDAGADVASGPAPLCPAAVGRSWTTRTVTNNPTSGTTTCTIMVTVTGKATVEGRSVFVEEGTMTCTPSYTSTWTTQFSVVGDVVESWATSVNPPTWYRGVDEPVAAGHTWDSYTNPPPNGQIHRAWVSSGPVTVTAGTFDDCWTQSWGSDYVSVIGYDTWCRGVGYVKGSADYGCSTCETSTTELISKNF